MLIEFVVLNQKSHQPFLSTWLGTIFYESVDYDGGSERMNPNPPLNSINMSLKSVEFKREKRGSKSILINQS